MQLQLPPRHDSASVMFKGTRSMLNHAKAGPRASVHLPMLRMRDDAASQQASSSQHSARDEKTPALRPRRQKVSIEAQPLLPPLPSASPAAPRKRSAAPRPPVAQSEPPASRRSHPPAPRSSDSAAAAAAAAPPPGVCVRPSPRMPEHHEWCSPAANAGRRRHVANGGERKWEFSLKPDPTPRGIPMPEPMPIAQKMAMLKTGLKRRLELDVIRDHAAEEKERTARLMLREEKKAAEARLSREALFRKEEAAYVARRVQAHMARSLAQIRSQETHREVVMDAEARKAAKARYRAAMAAAQNGRRLMLRDMEQYKAGLIDLQGIQRRRRLPSPRKKKVPPDLSWMDY